MDTFVRMTELERHVTIAKAKEDDYPFEINQFIEIVSSRSIATYIISDISIHMPWKGKFRYLVILGFAPSPPFHGPFHVQDL